MTFMTPRKFLDRDFLIPIGVTGLSIIGFAFVFFLFRMQESRREVPPEATDTPFKYLFLGTVTSTPTLNLTKQVTVNETPTLERNASSSPAFSTAEAGTNQPGSELTMTATLAVIGTPTLNPAIFPAGKFDDIDDRILYDGDWVSEIVDTAYGETLFISTLVGDTAGFTFTGTQFTIGYLEDPGLGIVTIIIDGTEYTLDQSNGFEWVSPELPPGEHTVTMIHETGEIIILDYLIIL